MEGLVSTFSYGKKVLITGHTGFKGSWLTLWLQQLGARVTGIALPPVTSPSLFTLLHFNSSDLQLNSYYHDIREAAKVTELVQAAEPEIVFHLAAQPLVRASYRNPLETWETNVLGTAHLLEAVRQTPSVKAVVVVTTDKCYRNNEWVWGYRESDPLGGHDPYSASKAATELVAASYRQSFLAGQGVLLATARAGNVIGGGDWSEDRLIPDAARAAATGTPLIVRSPDATRPWQHVLDALHGYLLLAGQLLAGNKAAADAWNFGPDTSGNLPVATVLNRLQNHWPELAWQTAEHPDAPHEAGLLYLDSSKARRVLGWEPRWGLADSLKYTADWYRAVQADPAAARAVTEKQIEMFITEEQPLS